MLVHEVIPLRGPLLLEANQRRKFFVGLAAALLLHSSDGDFGVVGPVGHCFVGMGNDLFCVRFERRSATPKLRVVIAEGFEALVLFRN